jgi:dihydrofolate reductase
MGLLTFSINVTLDGCVDHQEGIADDETHAFFTRLMDEGGAMLWGRVTYEMMESYWPAVARGDAEAPPAMREWAVKLEAKPKYVVSSTRKDFPWTNSHHITDDLRTGVQKLKDATPDGVLLGSGKLATELDRLDLIDEYKLLVHPRIAGHGPTLYESGLPSHADALELISAEAAPQRRGVARHLPARALTRRSVCAVTQSESLTSDIRLREVIDDDLPIFFRAPARPGGQPDGRLPGPGQGCLHGALAKDPGRCGPDDTGPSSSTERLSEISAVGNTTGSGSSATGLARATGGGASPPGHSPHSWEWSRRAPFMPTSRNTISARFGSWRSAGSRCASRRRNRSNRRATGSRNLFSSSVQTEDGERTDRCTPPSQALQRTAAATLAFPWVRGSRPGRRC